ncbi:MAG: thioredoxin domain-containing protein [Planctomycetes bacterium]|nr:thioredoxin domain-containing protein [Planctomycetota bacterium]
MRAGEFVLARFWKEDHLLRRWAGGEAAFGGVLDDYAYLLQGFLDLYETTFEERWITAALALNESVIAQFYDSGQGGFFFTPEGGEELIARGKSGFDNARPSGNGIMALNLLRLYELTGDKRHHERARKTLDFFGARVTASALGFSTILNALDFAASKPRSVFLAGEAGLPAFRITFQDPRRRGWRAREPAMRTGGG